MSRAGLFVLAAALTGLGVTTLRSASAGTGGLPGIAAELQLSYALLGAASFAVLAQAPAGRLRAMAYGLWGGAMALLIAVPLFGELGGGARSWLAFGGLRVQPVEIAKLAVPLALARAAARPWESRTAAHHAAILGLIALPVGLLAAQPDLGGALLVGLNGALILLIAGIPHRVLVGIAGLGAAALPALASGLHPYQWRRITSFWRPEADPEGAGYQVLQARYAFEAGGLQGHGWMAGTQGRLGFLPEHETDFILAHLAEERGLLGVAVVLLGLGALSGSLLGVAARARDPFSALLATGLGAGLGLQVLVNAGGALGLLPLTGVTLPFFSYGGSSLWSCWAAVGLGAALAAHPARGLARGSVNYAPNEVIPDWEAVLDR